MEKKEEFLGQYPCQKRKLSVRDLEIRGGANKIVTGPMEGKARPRLGKIQRTNLNFMNVIKTS